MRSGHVLFVTEDISFPIDEGMKKFNYALSEYFYSNYENFKLFTGYNNNLPLKYEEISNRSFISLKLRSSIRRFRPDYIIYSPSSSGTLFSFIRLFILKCYYSRCKTILINLQRRKHSWFGVKVIKLIKPDLVVTFSEIDYQHFSKIGIKSILSKTGVDIQKFTPVSVLQKKELRKKYELTEIEQVVLHVGHINKNRNISVFKLIKNAGYTAIIAGSTSTESDKLLLDELRKSEIRVMNTFITGIEEIYQLSDVYVFPVINDHSAIEFPLSVLEAMACNLPVVTTPFGSLKDHFTNTGCFAFYSNNEELLEKIRYVSGSECNNRDLIISDFSWEIVFKSLFDKLIP